MNELFIKIGWIKISGLGQNAIVLLRDAAISRDSDSTSRDSVAMAAAAMAAAAKAAELAEAPKKNI